MVYWDQNYLEYKNYLLVQLLKMKFILIDYK